MIKIDFFDSNGRFVVRHTLEKEQMSKFPFLKAKRYVLSVFYWYESACYAYVSINGMKQEFKRYE